MEYERAPAAQFSPTAWHERALATVAVDGGIDTIASLLVDAATWLPDLTDDGKRARLLRSHAITLREHVPLYDLAAALIAPWLAESYKSRIDRAPSQGVMSSNLIALLVHLHRPAAAATDPWLGLVEILWSAARAGMATVGTAHRLAAQLLLTYTDDFARGLVETLAIDDADAERLTLLLGRDATSDPATLLPVLTSPPLDRSRLLPPAIGDHLTVMGLGHYQAVREALSHNTFGEVAGQQWPTAELGRRGALLGRAQLRPPSADAQQLLSTEQVALWSTKMWQQRGELSDLDADVLDALSAIWIHQATGVQDSARATVDGLLELRGILPKLQKDGRRTGFQHRQRQDVLKALSHIQNLWIDIVEREHDGDQAMVEGEIGGRRRPGRLMIQSRAFVITDRVGIVYDSGEFDINLFQFRPGEVFAAFLLGAGNQAALLSAQALRYDPYRQIIEKRLARFLSWQWRSSRGLHGRGQGYSVEELLKAAGKEPDTRRPTETRDRLERALDTLGDDGVIAGWHYRDWQEPNTGQRGWLALWLGTTVVVVPPAVVTTQYEQTSLPVPQLAGAVGGGIESAVPEQKTLPQTATEIGALLKHERVSRGKLTQGDVARELGVTQSFISKLERGQSADRLVKEPLFRARLSAWLATIPE